MTIKTLLACMLDQSGGATLAAAGTALADRFGAHLTGLHTLEAVIVYPGIGMYVPGPTFELFNEAQKAEGAAIRKVFDEAVRRAAVTGEWREVHSGAADASERMIESARAADLVLMARPDSVVDRPNQRHAFGRVVREGGRPVLLVPPGGLGDGIGKRVVLAHAATRESARAAFDMLPLLRPGCDVHVVHVGDERDELRDAAMTELSSALSRHGHGVTMTHRARHGDGVADVLMREAPEVGADLIAAGAFGHSRTYDFFVGATTGALMRESEVPVLFST
ncbi:universal stress protein [Jannaschia sp. Os4]|uniref:universal stress protein n=1 Tax=Jannaschia sp. Os4 TaxID=2807617 RepID=UPI00193AB73C|nr:universal stress protein [Jannaschia sp. Os4]MBM2576340.1 universal stress protein [Jannaschia sp. Os4]